MSAKKIVTCFPIDESRVDQICETAGDDFEVEISSQEQIPSKIMDADIFFGHAKAPIDWTAVVQANRLNWIQSSAAGLDHCLTPEVIESDILVSGCSGLFAPQVAEQAMALLMGMVRSMPVFMRAQQTKEYVRRPTDDLFGKTVGIIGFGGNGQRIAQVLKPMVETIIASDCFPDACRSLVENGTIQIVFPDNQIQELISQSDVVIVTLPLSDANEQLIGEDLFRHFKPGAYLINVGRGSVIQTDALIASLKLGGLAGVGIDVVDPEPLPANSPLWTFENVLISPHVGAQSPRRIPVTVDLFCENLNRFRDGKSLLNQVDKVLGFPRPENRIDLTW